MHPCIRDADCAFTYLDPKVFQSPPSENKRLRGRVPFFIINKIIKNVRRLWHYSKVQQEPVNSPTASWWNVMSVGVATVSASPPPIIANGGQDLANTFMRVYGRLKESWNLKLSVFGNNNYSITF